MDSDRLAEIAERGAELLDDDDRAAIDVLAAVLAPRLAEQLAPGMGSMVVPAPFCEALGTAAPYPMRFNLAYMAPDYGSLEVLPGQDGTLTLTLEINSMRVWTGKLRGPLPAQPKETPA